MADKQEVEPGKATEIIVESSDTETQVVPVTVGLKTGEVAIGTTITLRDPDTVEGKGERVAYPASEYGDDAIDGGV